MKYSRSIIFTLIIILFSFSSFFAVIKTDYAIFLFDNGEKNMIASMLNYAQQHATPTLENLDFKIVFMGPALDGMSQEPFCNFRNKIIDYKQLGIEETIDRHWTRNATISQTSLKNIFNNLQIRKKIFVGVSCTVFGQILQLYQTNQEIETIALRDNPNLYGDGDYFSVAQHVQIIAKTIAVPSKLIAQDISCGNKKVTIIGHAPTEEWQKLAQKIDTTAIINRLEVNSQKLIIAYAGSYGDDYQNAFKLFLKMLQDEKISKLNLQIIIVPHPRYQGSFEKKLCQNFDYKTSKFFIADDTKELTRTKTIEALAIADIVVVPVATSTIVTQAKALSKEVFYINATSNYNSQELEQKNILIRISTTDEFIKALEKFHKNQWKQNNSNDIFNLFGIPKNGSQLLWQLLVSNETQLQ